MTNVNIYYWIDCDVCGGWAGLHHRVHHDRCRGHGPPGPRPHNIRFPSTFLFSIEFNPFPFLTCSDQGWLHGVPRSDGLCAPGLRHLRLHHDLCSLHQAQFWSGRRSMIQTLSLQSHGGGLCWYRSHHILNLPCYRHAGIQLSIIWYLREEEQSLIFEIQWSDDDGR